MEAKQNRKKQKRFFGIQTEEKTARADSPNALCWYGLHRGPILPWLLLSSYQL